MFWRRKSNDVLPAEGDEAVGPLEPGSPGPESVEPDWQPEPADFDDPAVVLGSTPAGPDAAPAGLDVASGSVPDPPPAIASSGSLEAGVARSRGGFVARLRGLLGGSTTGGPSWEDVEETLIGGDVGASLAIEIVERAR